MDIVLVRSGNVCFEFGLTWSSRRMGSAVMYQEAVTGFFERR